MKTTLLFLSVFLSASLFGQNVYIPDANFKAYLVGNSEINTNGDTEIQVSEATAFDGTINCANLGIYTFFGLDKFINLTELNVSNNYIPYLDLGYNLALEKLYCDNNSLSSLVIYLNTALTTIDCSYNSIYGLDVSHCTLDTLVCSSNNFLGCLILGDNYAVSAINNPNLTCVQVEDNIQAEAYWGNITVPNFDPEVISSENCGFTVPGGCTSMSNITELTTPKNLIQILDMMGRETSFKPNTPLIYVYDDGSIEKVFSVEY